MFDADFIFRILTIDPSSTLTPHPSIMDRAKQLARTTLLFATGVTIVERAVTPAVKRFVSDFLSFLCQRNKLAHDKDGGFYCSSLPFFRSLSLMTSRVVCYSLLLGRYGNIDIRSVLSGVGVYGILVGWALNKVFKEAISGALIVATQPLRVGEHIIVRTQMMNFEGIVDAITLQHTVLTNGAGPGDVVGEDLHTILIPNSVLLNAVVRVVNDDEVDSVTIASTLNSSGFIDV